MADVKIYTTSYCPYCTRAKEFLKARGVTFQEVDVSGDHDARMRLVEITRMRTVPQIFINDQPIGGYDDMVALDRAGKLTPLLAAG